MRRCHHCGAEWVNEKKQPGVKEYCDQCSAYLHCCLNCRYHDPLVHNECHIPTTDWVADKAGANFCDEFEFTDAATESADESGRDRARGELGRLFGTESRKCEAEALDAFKKLMGD
ncbi:MAG: hypothetical protein HY706_21140 [Candidatus Hydrogenedentes bacterium]|nr:hypothetical protein [Candidatus Hydrogenedentota bacterium]